MTCANCQQSLESYERGGAICRACGLVHTIDGYPEGWIVCVEGTPGGIVRFESLVPFGDHHSPLNRVLVATIVRIAAELGVKNIDAIRHRLDREDVDAVTEAMLEGMIDAGGVED